MTAVMHFRLFILTGTFFMTSCATMTTEPTPRDTSKDDPKKVAEVAKLTTPKKGPPKTYQERAGLITEYRPSWTTYRIDELKSKTTRALQIQVLSAPGQKGKIWLETRNIGPDSAVVTRMLLNTAKDQMIKVNDSQVQINKLERMIIWDESKANAEEWSDKQVASTNEMARALGSTMVPKQPVLGTKEREARTLAGIFPHCHVEDQEQVWIIIDEQHTCYSSAVPMPHIVEIESKERHQQLVDFGFGTRPSLLPKHIKVIKAAS